MDAKTNGLFLRNNQQGRWAWLFQGIWRTGILVAVFANPCWMNASGGQQKDNSNAVQRDVVSKENGPNREGAKLDDQSQNDPGKLREIKQPLDDTQPTQKSRSLISIIFSSLWGIVGVVLLFFVIFAIVYFSLKAQQSSKGGV